MNLSVAEALSQDRDSAKWTASIHCSYYAVFQYMKYLLAMKAENPITYEVQDAHKGEDSHTYILDEIKNRITSSTEERNVTQTIRLLRKSRKLADYTDKIFTQDEALDCKSQADNVVRKLYRLFSS